MTGPAPMQRFTLAEVVQAQARLDVITADVAMKRAGRELAGLCPFHNEKTPSFYVNPDKGFFHCFGCGAHGTAIDYLMRTRNVGFIDAVTELLGLPQQRAKVHSPALIPPPHEGNERNTAAEIREVLAGCVPITDRTAAHLYLWSRGLRTQQPGLLAHPALYCHEIRGPLPALVAPITNSADEITAVQRIWVVDRIEDTTAKDARAPLKVRKKTLGRMGDGSVRLRPADKVLGLAEGVETAIAAMAMERGVPVWAVCGIARLGFPAHWQQRRPALHERSTIWIPPEEPPAGSDAVWSEERPPSIWIPPEVEAMRIYGDNGQIGEAVAKHAAAWWTRHGLPATVVLPEEPFSDFNDQLNAIQGRRR